MRSRNKLEEADKLNLEGSEAMCCHESERNRVEKRKVVGERGESWGYPFYKKTFFILDLNGINIELAFHHYLEFEKESMPRALIRV